MNREAMQQALEALTLLQGDIEWTSNSPTLKFVNSTVAALRAALAELDSDYERGFVDGMNLQTKGSVDKAVNRMAQNPFGDDAERYARKLHEEREAYKALFTAPTPRKPLTDEEIQSIWAKTFEMGSSANTFARAIEAAIRSRT